MKHTWFEKGFEREQRRTLFTLGPGAKLGTFFVGVLERHLQRFETMEEEVIACGGGVTAYLLRPDMPGWAYAYIMLMANSPACLCCKRRPCGEPTVIVSVQATEGATSALPMPVCIDCCNYNQIKPAIDCVCADLFTRPVRVQLMTYKKEAKP